MATKTWRDYFPGFDPSKLGGKPWLTPGYGLAAQPVTVNDDIMSRWYQSEVARIGKMDAAQKASVQATGPQTWGGGVQQPWAGGPQKMWDGSTWTGMGEGEKAQLSTLRYFLAQEGKALGKPWDQLPMEGVYRARDALIREGLKGRADKGGFNIGGALIGTLLGAAFGLPPMFALPNLVGTGAGLMKSLSGGGANVPVRGAVPGTDSKTAVPSVLGGPVTGAGPSRTGRVNRARRGRAASILSEDFAGGLGG